MSGDRDAMTLFGQNVVQALLTLLNEREEEMKLRSAQTDLRRGSFLQASQTNAADSRVTAHNHRTMHA